MVNILFVVLLLFKIWDIVWWNVDMCMFFCFWIIVEIIVMVIDFWLLKILEIIFNRIGENSWNFKFYVLKFTVVKLLFDVFFRYELVLVDESLDSFFFRFLRIEFKIFFFKLEL